MAGAARLIARDKVRSMFSTCSECVPDLERRRPPTIEGEIFAWRDTFELHPRWELLVPVPVTDIDDDRKGGEKSEALARRRSKVRPPLGGGGVPDLVGIESSAGVLLPRYVESSEGDTRLLDMIGD